MWTIKIALLAAGVTVTAFVSNSSADLARCAAAHETAGEMAPGKTTTVADVQRDACLPRK